MSTDSWDDRRRAQEEQFFAKQNAEAVKRLRSRTDSKGSVNPQRLSPVSGQPMVEKTIMGVVVDQCPTSGGIWLDAGELEHLMSAGKATENQAGWLQSFVGQLTKSR